MKSLFVPLSSLLLVCACMKAEAPIVAEAGKVQVDAHWPLLAAVRDDVVSLEVHQQRTYTYTPLEDITTFELAKLLPLFAGPTHAPYGWTTGGRLLPDGAGFDGTLIGGCLATGQYLRLTAYEIEKLGSAARHLRACDI